MGKKKPDTLGVKAINKHKIKIELTKPIPYIKELLAFGTFMPVNPKIVKNMVKDMELHQTKLYLMVLLK